MVANLSAPGELHLAARCDAITWPSVSAELQPIEVGRPADWRLHLLHTWREHLRSDAVSGCKIFDVVSAPIVVPSSSRCSSWSAFGSAFQLLEAREKKEREREREKREYA